MGRDVIVIGAGHNGLTAAAWLARGGRGVIVVEQLDRVGGLAGSDEFHPGYRSAGIFHDTTGVRPHVVEALELERHGLRVRRGRPDILALGDDSSLLLHGDAGLAAEQIAAHSERDAERYANFRALVERIRPTIRKFLDEPPIDLVHFESAGPWRLLRRLLRLRGLGSRDLPELLRLVPLSVADWLNEWFETDLLKAALALPAVGASSLGPRAPASNANLLRLEGLAGAGFHAGGHALIDALERSARSAGVEIRTGARVERLMFKGTAARGVVLESGEAIDAPVVAASCDPGQVFLRLLPPGLASHRLETRFRKIRARGTTAQVLLALDRLPGLACRPGQMVEYARIGSRLDQLEQAFDAVKYGEVSRTPVLDVHWPTLASPELAPAGHAVVSILVHCAPFDLEGGWTAARREALGDRVVQLLERHCPGVGAAVVARQVLTPLDLASRHILPSGNLHHGEHALDQLLIRPAPECTNYRTPLPGLFLCGSGSHPGGGLTCAPGALAAQAILNG